MGRVELHDVDKSVFQALLTYVYSGTIDEEFLATKCEEVLALADKVRDYLSSNPVVNFEPSSIFAS